MTVTEDHIRYGYVDLPETGGKAFFAPNYSFHRQAVGYLPVDFVKKYATTLTFKPGPKYEDYPKSDFLYWITASPFSRKMTPVGGFWDNELRFTNGINRTASLIQAGATHIPFTLDWECWNNVCEKIELPLPLVPETQFPKLQRASRYYTSRPNHLSYQEPWESWYLILGDEQPLLEEMIGSLLEMHKLLSMEIECLDRKPKLYADYAVELSDWEMKCIADNLNKSKSYLDSIERILPILMQMHLAGEKPPVEHVVAMARGNMPLAA